MLAVSDYFTTLTYLLIYLLTYLLTYLLKLCLDLCNNVTYGIIIELSLFTFLNST